jgi:hypothetical protein
MTASTIEVKDGDKAKADTKTKGDTKAKVEEKKTK